MSPDNEGREFLRKLSTKELMTQWEFTEILGGQRIIIIRGWIMDELKERDPDAYDKWMDQEEPGDPYPYFMR